MDECIFCQIAAKQMPAKIIYEDDSSIAFLDINPRSKGMAILAPKQHYKEFDENFDLSFKLMQTALIVAEMLKQALQTKSVSIAMMSSETVHHFHVRLYPVYEKEIPLIENKPIKISELELDALAEKIRGIKVEVKLPEAKEKEEVAEEPKPKPKKRKKEEIEWVKRELEVG